MYWNLFKSRITLLLYLACSLWLVPALAQDKDKLYVTDKLRLSLYERPDDRSKVVKLLISGDLLVIEELSGLYALVTTDDNVRGWVKRGFLVSEPTSNLLLEEALQKNEALQEEVRRLGSAKQVIDQYDKDMNALNEKALSLERENGELQTRIVDLEQQLDSRQAEVQSLQVSDGDVPGISLQLVMTLVKQYWKPLAIALTILVLLIFIISKIIIEARIRHRFQGIKVW